MERLIGIFILSLCSLVMIILFLSVIYSETTLSNDVDEVEYCQPLLDETHEFYEELIDDIVLYHVRTDLTMAEFLDILRVVVEREDWNYEIHRGLEGE